MTNDSMAASSSAEQTESTTSLAKLYERLIKKVVSKKKLSTTDQQSLALIIFRRLNGSDRETFKNSAFYSFIRTDPAKGARVRTHSESSTDAARGGKKKEGEKPRVPHRQLLEAVKAVEDDLACMVLTRLYLGYNKYCTQKVRLRRIRAFIKLDATKTFAQVLTNRLEDDKWTESVRRDVIVDLACALMVTQKDRRFSKKIGETDFFDVMRKKIVDINFGHKLRKIFYVLRTTVRLRKFAVVVAKDDFIMAIVRIIEQLNADIERQIEQSPDEISWNPTLLLRDRSELLGDYLSFVLCFAKNRARVERWIKSKVVFAAYDAFTTHIRRRTQRCHLNVALSALGCLQAMSFMDRAAEQLESRKMRLATIVQELSTNMNEAMERGDFRLLQEYCDLQESLASVCTRLLRTDPFPFRGMDSPVYTFDMPKHEENDKKEEKRRLSEDLDSVNDEVHPETFCCLSTPNRPKIEEEETPSDGEDNGSSYGEDLSDGELDEDQVQEPQAKSTPIKDEIPDLSGFVRLTKLKSSFRTYFSEFLNGASAGSHSPHGQQASSVGRYVKHPLPDTVESKVYERTEVRSKLENVRELSKVVAEEVLKWGLEDRPEVERELVFDLDELVKEPSTPCEDRYGKVDVTKPLCFESRFESGNLRKAYQIGPKENNHYELVLSPDIGTNKHHFQWFYFEVSNVRKSVEYTFDIINLHKVTSMFSKGMQPVIFSTANFNKDRFGWKRRGTSVCYYRNRYYTDTLYYTDEQLETPETENAENSEGPAAPPALKEKKLGQCFTLRFQMSFEDDGDVVYIAYHYPYTYTKLNETLERLVQKTRDMGDVSFRVEHVGKTLGSNPFPLVTITAPGSPEEVSKREVVFITARVHPGESNSSWMMKGALDYLTESSDQWAVAELRQKFVFKIVPMLNPDGVINGNHRCSLAGRDLNRVWKTPTFREFPTIFNTRAMVQYSVDVLKKTPFVFVDLHGHSREKNVFIFGNNPTNSSNHADQTAEAEAEAKSVYMLPEQLNKIARGFRLQQCRYNVSEKKAGSARIALWRDFKIPRCYTMESTFFAFSSNEQDKYDGIQIGINELEEMGKFLCQGILQVKKKAESFGGLDRSEELENTTLGNIVNNSRFEEGGNAGVM
ncbi:hypothetical protein L596_007594 [Steinernema carpocapsae]|uniref:Peptidase M14 domain-containing protein n=1 Tax=Steinernema carpocapsae TaxID=34508 RepID=A0A4U5P9V3_STECR|nr:hypothetical protein L596_007594 [Steinernema carpocapsae]